MGPRQAINHALHHCARPRPSSPLLPPQRMPRRTALFLIIIACALHSTYAYSRRRRTSSSNSQCKLVEKRANVSVTTRYVDTSECPENCCVNDECAPEKECRGAIIAGIVGFLIIVGCLVSCCCWARKRRQAQALAAGAPAGIGMQTMPPSLRRHVII